MKNNKLPSISQLMDQLHESESEDIKAPNTANDGSSNWPLTLPATSSNNNKHVNKRQPMIPDYGTSYYYNSSPINVNVNVPPTSDSSSSILTPIHPQNVNVNLSYPPQSAYVNQFNVNLVQAPANPASNYYHTPLQTQLPLPAIQNTFINKDSDIHLQSRIQSDFNAKQEYEPFETSLHNYQDDYCRCIENSQSHQHIPRPRNAFILFRQHWHQQIFTREKEKINSDAHSSSVKSGSFKANSQASRDIGQRWRLLDDKERQYWLNLAKLEKAAHKKKYPDYKYIPTRKSKRNLGSSAGSNHAANASNKCNICHKPKT